MLDDILDDEMLDNIKQIYLKNKPISDNSESKNLLHKSCMSSDPHRIIKTICIN